jgi:arginine repressor
MKYIKKFILKESISQEDIDNGLAYLKDDGFEVNKVNISRTNMIQIYKIKNINGNTIVSNMIKVEWMDIEKDLLPFIELNNNLIKEIIITYPIDNEYDRIILTTEEILNSNKDFGKLVRVTIILKD